jgi:2-oxoglutarate ferredoxin oxidoreductase subunit beta
MSTTQVAVTTKKDWSSDQEVRWCPGCGDYGILLAVQTLMPDLGIAPENTVFVSGIGCSSRFPYYMNTYGMHSIHGRAPAIATGIAVARPDLDVWVITGDGDGLSIGGNHMLHALRRNMDLQIVLFNNEIYGLTKGQTSPTTKRGTVTPSTPQGSVGRPVAPAAFALGAGGKFVARAVDTMQAELVGVLERAHAHRGASFVEIFQNCVVFNDGAHAAFTDRATAPDMQLHVEHGKPLVFGKDRDKGIVLACDGPGLEVVKLGPGEYSEADLLVHDETNIALALLLAQLQPPEFPMALGVLYCNPVETYDHAVHRQAGDMGARPSAETDLQQLLRSGRTWRVG